MSFWKRLFGFSDTIKSKNQSTIDTNHGTLFTARLREHLQDINAVGEQYSQFIQKYFSNEVVNMLTVAAKDKMSLAQADSQEHSFCVSKEPISYWICTLPYSISEAKRWFMKAYGGYSKLLESAWNSDYFRGPGCEVLIHIVYGRTGKEGWINMTIFPVGSKRFGIKPILPVDLLTDSERAYGA